ncbi:hypothetical protein D3C71_1050280 [compost metagenome]
MLARFLRCLSHHCVQPLRDTFELHHAGAQQVALQLPCLAPLGDQIVFGTFHGTLQVALHGGHVVHRLGHHACELLHTGKAVKLQRIKARRRVLRQGQARLHLRFSLQLDVPQLLAQTVQIARQVSQRAAELTQPHIQARAADHHLTRLIDQPVQQLGTHPHRLVSSNTQRRELRRTRQAHRRSRGHGRRGCCCWHWS